jgi:hypothetical protein
VNANLLIIIIGVFFYLAILLVILAFCKTSAHADRDMRAICKGELLYSNAEGRNTLKLTIDDKVYGSRIRPKKLSKGLHHAFISDRRY